MHKNVSLLIADDHDLFRKGIIELLKYQKDLVVLGEAEDGEDLVNKFFSLSPDILLIDIVMPKLNGIEAFLRIKEKDSSAKALFLSAYSDEQHIYKILKAGGHALVCKKGTKDELVHALREVSAGRQYFGKALNNDNITDYIKHLEDEQLINSPDAEIKLHPREEEVFLLYGTGITTQEIADSLFVSRSDIDFHRRNIMRKLQIKTFPEFIAKAVLYKLDRSK